MQMFTVKLDDIVEHIELQSDEVESYLNKTTGELHYISSEEMNAAENDDPIEKAPDWQQANIKIAKEISETDNYLELPSQYDVHEYKIMERFCHTVEEEKANYELLRAISGKGAFRRFKEVIHDFDIAKDWYEYKNKALKEIAKEWCEDNNIKFE
jgi:hypothetical protein